MTPEATYMLPFRLATRTVRTPSLDTKYSENWKRWQSRSYISHEESQHVYDYANNRISWSLCGPSQAFATQGACFIRAIKDLRICPAPRTVRPFTVHWHSSNIQSKLFNISQKRVLDPSAIWPCRKSLASPDHTAQWIGFMNIEIKVYSFQSSEKRSDSSIWYHSSILWLLLGIRQTFVWRPSFSRIRAF